jgi:hypothetical protein
LEARIAKEKIMLNPVMVAPLKDGRFVVLDGANRVTAFRNLKIPHIVAQVLDYRLPDVQIQTWNHIVCDPRFKNVFPSGIKRFKRSETKEMLAFTGLYKSHYDYRRVIGDDIKSFKEEFEHFTCLVIFPKFQPKDIERYALTDQKIPAGITRHIIQNRALHIRVPLRILGSSNTIQNKNHWLEKRLLFLKRKNRVRYYAESISLFDE